MVSCKREKVLLKRRLKDNRGQSTIEFVLTFSISLVVLFLFVKVAYIFVDGYVVHYATFAASRVYLVHDRGIKDPAGSDGPAFSEAKEMFQKYVKKGELKVNAPDGNAKSVYIGVYHEYKRGFTESDLVGGKHDLKFRSESFLGREPTSSGCFERTCAAMTFSGGTCGEHTTIFDNGC